MREGGRNRGILRYVDLYSMGKKLNFNKVRGRVMLLPSPSSHYALLVSDEI